VAPRPYWKGYLKLSLVSCPIALHTATSSSERVSFRQVNRRTGNRLRQQLVDEVTREPVEAEDKAKGYEVEKNVFLIVDDEELEAVEIASNHTVEIDSFVPRDQIDQRYLDNAYYIVPDDKVGQEAFAVIRDAMKGKDMVALGRIVLGKRERVMMLEPFDKGIMATTLRYPYEVRNAADYFSDIPDLKIPGEMLKLADHILESKTADFDPSTFVDHYEEAVVDMLRRKQAGAPARKERAGARPSNVVNLLDALKKSIAEEKRAAPKAKTGKKRVEGQREMLLPIPGKGGKREAAKPVARSPGRQKKAG
jgi:DNA end-binding protein Ku